MYESLLTHCHQACPQFEIIFGVNDATDPAIPFIEKLKSEFPQIPIRTVVSTQVLGANRKVSNLVQMLEVAQFNHILINDADIRVPVNYLRDVMSHFADAKVGMVTCLYRAVAGNSIWSKIEALSISTDFMPGVLVARFIDRGVRFGLGSTMVVTREALNLIGGLQPLVDHLADDFELGNRIANAGYKVVLARSVVETFLPDYTFREFFQHQLRWGRTVRSSRPGGYFGLVVTFGLLWSLLAVVASGAALWSWMLLGCVLLVRVAVAIRTGMNILLDPDALAHLWLLPLRDLIAPVVWLGSLFGNRIVWRGEEFHLQNGKLQGK
ncbi:MAG: Ceramide glucosyltransferase [Acidobacteriales bacterium]|nr:Ceramide glucosyltransferase [Terriglobales bacterium]